MDIALAGIAIVALGVGLVAGWLAWGRPLASALREREAIDQRFRQAITELAGAEERARQAAVLQQALDATRDERDAARLQAERLSAEAGERASAFEQRLTELREAKEALSAQFSEVGQKLLAEAQAQFLHRAGQRFEEQGKESEAKLKLLLQPVETTLKRYEEGVAKVEEERRREQGNLTGLIESLRVGQEAVRGEAAKLVNALRAAPKARGRWGEQQLRNVLETCGLAEHTDFVTEFSVTGEDGRLRPDAIIRIPGGRALVVDAKVSLNAYQDAFGAVDEAERAQHLALHCASMKAHVSGLGAKAYWSQFAEAPDFVIMFVPGEHFLAAALEHDPTLWDFAFDKRVLLATPTNLIAVARTVAATWRQEKLAEEAQKIGKLGKDMYDRLAVAAGHLKTVGSGLNMAVNNYNKFVSSFESRVLVTGREFRDLNIETGAKEIEAIPPIEALARDGQPELRALSDTSSEAAE